MAATGNDRDDANPTWYPILAGAVVGLVTGLLGMFVTMAVSGHPLGGFVGAVGCGVTAALLSRGVYEGVVHAVVADVASSLAFFLLVLVGYLAYVWATEGLALVSAIYFTMMYLGIGGLGAAVPIGMVSLVVAGLSAAIAGLARGSLAEPTAQG